MIIVKRKDRRKRGTWKFGYPTEVIEFFFGLTNGVLYRQFNQYRIYVDGVKLKNITSNTIDEFDNLIMSTHKK